MLEVVKVSYLNRPVEYVYENDLVIAVYHVDTDTLIIDEEVSIRSEEEIREALAECRQ